VADLVVILAIYLAGMAASAEYMARRENPPGEVLGCAAVLWPVIVPIAVACRAAAAVGNGWLRLRRVWEVRR